MDSWIKITFIVILIIIVIFIVTLALLNVKRSIKKVGHQGPNLKDVFGEKGIKLEELIQVQELYKADNLDYFRTYNPCAFKLKTKGRKRKDDRKDLYIVYRMSNFTMCEGGKSIPWTPLDMSNIESHTFIQSPSGEMFKIVHPELSHGTCIRGCEDARTILHKDKLWVTCNAASGDGCKKEMTLMEIPLDGLKKGSTKQIFKDSSIMVKEIYPDRITKLTIDFDKNRDQKNWMPFVMNDNIHFVYSLNPHIILRCNEDGSCIKVSETQNNLNKNLRGGSQIVKVKFEKERLYVGVVHLREEHSEYMTYFYAFESVYPYKIKYITESFVISKNDWKKRVQFASGLEKVYEDNIPYFYILYGEDDCNAKLCKLPIKSVLKSFKLIE